MASSQAGGGGGGFSNYVSPKGTPTYQQLRAATPFTGTAVRPGGTGNVNSANATEHDLLTALAAANHPAAGALPGALNHPVGPLDPYAGLDPNQMAANEFAPQYALLDQLARQSQAKYNAAGQQVGGMWDALSKATAGQESGIKKNYSTAGSAIGKAYNDATAATNNAFSQSRNQIADIAQRLGIGAAIPSALDDGSVQQARLVALLQNAGANHQATNTELGNNDVTYNRNQANLDTQAGINARAGFASQLMAALQDLGNKRLGLQGQQSQAANNYGLSISKQKAADANAAAARASTDQYHQAQMMLEAAKLKQAADQFNQTQGSAANKNLSATEYLAQMANNEYGGNLLAATNAKNAILDTIAQGGPLHPGDAPTNHWANASDFVQSVLNRNPNSQHSGGDYRQLEQLALDYYNRLAGGANKPI
jgi:hypothetical protein